ncbi:MAG TPA: peroxiredoxin [Steroidobacter sp.]|uniref:peroxiredoxin n=1 Tax=Steroidobacter sp. TaxID=1978227 RepID=UPI002ED7B8A8
MPGTKASAAAKKTVTKAPAKAHIAKNQGVKAPATKAGPAGKVAVGKKVPAFSSLVTGGGSWKSSEAAGKNLVIYFYPRDNTTGCTAEGEAFRDLAPAFKKANTLILGVSTDSIASHEKFKAKYQFPFELLSDEEQALCQLFDVIKEKSMYGRKFMGVERSTFLIDASGVLRQEWRKVKVPGHADAVLAAARSL